MRGTRAKRLRKLHPRRVNPGRRYGGDPAEIVPWGDVRILLGKARKTTDWKKR